VVISGVKRVRLRFVPGLEIEFTDRNRGVEQVYELAEKGTRLPIVVFGPEGCGKSAWLKQVAEVLKENKFNVIYTDVVHGEYVAHTDVREVVDKLSEVVADVTGYSPIKLANTIIYLAKQLIGRWRKRKIALLIDEVFQAIGLDKVEVYVKSLLNIIEYPPESYENIVIIVATSEGLSRWRIGRHLWAEIKPVWNMSRRGFEELYERIPGSKPDFSDAWRLCGGNPRVLGVLYQLKWDIDKTLIDLAKGRRLEPSFIHKWGKWLGEAVEDPDALWSTEAPQDLVNELIARNLITYDLYPRDYRFWIDEPPPEKDLEMGVGRYVAWQTPLHREAVRKALEKYKGT
jgi:energy-coupling factor transporter ATP-binding protein EcfA2